jgi:branched-chain amino acid transport system substrate-binding protein
VGYAPSAALIIKQARELGGTFHIMGADAMDNPDMITIGGKDIEGFVYSTFPYAPDMPGMSEMAKTFTENWKVQFPDKDPNANSAIGYDSYMLLVDAIERAGSTDPEAITKALAETMNWEGVTGSTTINETHDAVKPVGFKRVEGGKQVYVGSVIPEM